MEINYMNASGKMAKDADMEYNIVLMVIKNIMVNGQKTKKMVVVYFTMKMVINTMVNSKMIDNMVMAFCIKKMAKYNVESG
jgi:ribosomal protein S7